MTTYTVTTGADSGTGSLRADLAAAHSGDTINFASNVTEVDLASTLTITTNVTIEGSQPAAIGTPGVAINGGGAGSNFSDFTVNAGVTTTLDGLIIQNGHSVGTNGAAGGGNYSAGSSGQSVSGGIFDAGSLTLSNSHLTNNSATGGTGGTGGEYGGGGGGGSAAGGVYVAAGASLSLSSVAAGGNIARGGAGGQGGVGYLSQASYSNLYSGGAGGAGGYAVNGGSATGSGGSQGPGQNGGGGGGGSAFADVGGLGTIKGAIKHLPGPVVTLGTTPASTSAGHTAIAPNLTISEPGVTTLASATVTITNHVAGDVLTATSVGGITTSYNSSTGVLSLSGVATIAQYDQVLDSVAFSSTASRVATAATYPNAGSRTISYLVSDGTVSSTAVTSTLNVLATSFADTAANVSAKFDALNANTNITAITITNGQALSLTQAQYNADARALSLVSSGAHSVQETGISGQTYTSRTLVYDSSNRISTSTLHNGSGAVVGSSSFSYGTGSAYTVTIQVTGTDYSQQIVSYDSSGNLASSEYDGYTDKAYTSLKTSYSGGVLHDKLLSGFTSGPYASMDIAYDSSGRNSTVTTYDGSGHALTTANYSYGTGGAYTVTTNFTSGPYTSQAVSYTASGQITSNDLYGYTGQAYSHIHFDYSNGAATVETFFNNDGSHLVQALTTGVALNDTAVNEAFYLTTGDTFTLSSPSFGQDTIRHYTPGSDTFDIYTGFGDFSQFIAAAHDDGHGDTLVTYDANDTLLFVNTTIAQLQAHSSDFNFFSS